MKHFALIILALASLCLVCCKPSSSKPVNEPTTTISDADRQAFDSVFMAIDGISVNELHSLLILKDGQLIYERYGAGHNAGELHSLWSGTKTFTALACGFAWQDGLLNPDTPIISYFRPEQLPEEISPRLARLTLHHLLSMSSGWASDTITTRMRGGEQFDPVAACLNRRFVADPGERWAYNNQNTYMAGILVEQVTGKRLQDYLQEKIFTPLEIDTFIYDADAMGHNLGATGLHLQASSFLKMAQLMLQKGEWNGQQLLDSAWINRMSSVQSMQPGGPGNTDFNSGYGYQVWMCRVPGSFRADGMWGQYAIVLPDKNAVVVMTSLCTDRDTQMGAVWKYIYPHL